MGRKKGNKQQQSDSGGDQRQQQPQQQQRQQQQQPQQGGSSQGGQGRGQGRGCQHQDGGGRGRGKGQGSGAPPVGPQSDVPVQSPQPQGPSGFPQLGPPQSMGRGQQRGPPQGMQTQQGPGVGHQGPAQSPQSQGPIGFPQLGQSQSMGRGEPHGHPTGPPQSMGRGQQRGPPQGMQIQQGPGVGHQGPAQSPQSQGPIGFPQLGTPAQQQAGPPAHQGGRKQGKGKKAPHGDQPGPASAQAPKTAPSSPQDKATIVKELQEKMDSMKLVSQKREIVRGKRGRPIPLESNHLTINLGNLRTVHHYDVNMQPDKPKRYLRNVFEAFRQKMFPKNNPAYDGKSSMYTCKLLPIGDSQSCEADVVIKNEDGGDKTYKVAIKKVATLDFTPLHNMYDTINANDALQALNVILRSAPARNCISVGNSFFKKPNQILELGNGMEMYQGFYQSAIRGGKLLLNVDVAHKAFPKALNCVDALMEVCSSYFQTFRREDLKKPLDYRDKETFGKFIRMLRVVYELPGQAASKRTFAVNGLGDPAHIATFQQDNGSSTTVFEYFKTSKRYIIKYPSLPTLWVGSRLKKILVPMECCTISPNQAVNRGMNENQTAAMVKYAATNTEIRKRKILDGVNQASYNTGATINEFGISVGNQFESLEGRVLKPPTLGYSNKTEVPQKGVWRNAKYLQGAVIDKWTIAYADRREPNNLKQFADMIFRQANDCGINITVKATEPFKAIGTRGLQDAEYYFKQNKGFKIIFVVVPNSGPNYMYVKTASEITIGCLTQCIKARTLNKLNPQTVGNILLKVNSKLSGISHALVNRPPIMDVPCMIMGADVTHPSPDSTNTPSVAAVVASHDPKASLYNICWRVQSPALEIIQDLKEIMKEHLIYFYRLNKQQKPQRIVFFRDGVSEGQFEDVKNKEIRAMQAAFSELEAGYQPRITFVVVQKRHHTRLFPKNPRDSEDRNMNVPAGTCVDHTILTPTMQAFYLVSHASIQGVAKPTKYCTIWDDNNFSNDDIEELAYYLCHMFSRCNRSVSYPAPTYYAHLAAARGKVYIDNEKSLDLNRLAETQNRYTIQNEIRKGLPMFFI